MKTEIITLPEKQLNDVLRNSLYPGASDMSLELVKSYCKAAALDIMLKPVHITPMWNSKEGKMVDTIMPGIGLYRINASRTGRYAGIKEPEYGPFITHDFNGLKFSFPEWCKITVLSMVGNTLVEFTAKEYWLENYAEKGGKEKDISPNTMWRKRPYAQIAKCAEAQALRKAFPEVGSQPTSDEMAGKTLNDEIIINPTPQPATVSLDSLLATINTMSVDDFKNIDVKAYSDNEKAIIRKACSDRKKAVLAAQLTTNNQDAIDGTYKKLEEPAKNTDWHDLINNSQSLEELQAVEDSLPHELLTAEYANLIDEQKDFLRSIKS